MSFILIVLIMILAGIGIVTRNPAVIGVITVMLFLLMLWNMVFPPKESDEEEEP